MIAVMAALFDDSETYAEVAQFKAEQLQHCNFQLWYPDEDSECNFYTGEDDHGAVLTNVRVDMTTRDLLARVFGECHETTYFEDLSAVRAGCWPLVVVACRHHRVPLPLHLFEPIRDSHSAASQVADGLPDDQGCEGTDPLECASQPDASAAGDGG